jgi:hypothetical protein
MHVAREKPIDVSLRRPKQPMEIGVVDGLV